MVTTRTLTRCPVPMSKTSKVEVSVSPIFLVDTETALTPVGPLTWCRSLSKHMLVVETVFDGTNMVQRHRVKNTETWHCPDERHIQWLDEDLYTTELVFSYFYFFTCSWAIDWNPLANRWLALCDDYSLNGLFHICQICPDAAFQNIILKRRVIYISFHLQKNYWFLWRRRMFPFMSYIEIKTHLEVVFPSEDVKWKGN